MSLDKIAKSAAFSKYHFHRIFHSIIGEPLNQYILRLRVEKAAHLLTETQLSITEIAYKCGFSNSSAFSRAFKTNLALLLLTGEKINVDIITNLARIV